MSEYHALTVRDVRKDTDDAVCLSFDVPDGLADIYRFEPGQYLTLRAEVGGEPVERSYSICSPVGSGLEVAVKRIPEGRFSTFVHETLKAGSEIDVLPPQGRFVAHLDPQAAHRYVAIAAGSGITPILSMVRSVLNAEPESEFVLLYGNSSIDTIMFQEELEDLKDVFMERFQLQHFLSREAMGTEFFSKRIDAETVRGLPELIGALDAFDAFFVCGPAGMIEGVSGALVEAGVPPEKVKVERFQNPGQNVTEKQHDARTIQSTEARVTVRHNGLTRTFDLSKDAPNLLDGAVAAGIDMPFSCKAGVCCTCRARVIEGEVELFQNYALEPWELKAGYTLTCQALPKTSTVTLDFDDA